MSPHQASKQGHSSPGGASIAAAQGAAAIQERLEALESRVARLEEALMQRDAVSRQLGRDVIAMGRGLSDRIRALEIRLGDRAGSGARPGHGPARRRPSTGHARPATAFLFAALGAVTAVLVIGAFWFGLRHERPWTQAGASEPASATPIVVVDDAVRQGAGNRAVGADDVAAHVLYGAPAPPVAESRAVPSSTRR